MRLRIKSIERLHNQQLIHICVYMPVHSLAAYIQSLTLSRRPCDLYYITIKVHVQQYFHITCTHAVTPRPDIKSTYRPWNNGGTWWLLLACNTVIEHKKPADLFQYVSIGLRLSRREQEKMIHANKNVIHIKGRNFICKLTT